MIKFQTSKTNKKERKKLISSTQRFLLIISRLPAVGDGFC